MNTKKFLLKNLLSFALVLVCAVSLEARVGDMKKDVQARLTARGGAYKYMREEYLREALELPYSDLFLIQPEEVNNSFFFKRTDAAGSSNIDTLNQAELYGWEIHIAYKDDVSVLESYRRCGDALSFEEVKGLMDLMIKNKGGVAWKRVEYAEYRPEEKDSKDAEYAQLFQKNTDRYIFLNAPSSIGKNSAFFSSVPFYMWEDERRWTMENYNKIQEQERKLSEARTAVGNAAKAKGSTKNFSESDIMFNRKTVIRFGTSAMSSFGEALPTKRTKDLWIGIKIPSQADTFLQYNFETTDGSLRAQINNNMIIFIDTAYDKLLRERVEKIYEKQEERRKRDTESSLANF